MTKIAIEFDRAGFNKIDAALAAIETNLRGKAVDNGLRAIGTMVKTKTQAVLPKAGYTRYTRTKGEPYEDKQEPKALEKTIKTKLVGQGGMIRVAIIGYEWPAGAHGHLVELGHKMVTHAGVQVGEVAPAEYMVTVVANNRSSFDSIMVSAAAKLIKV